jgi:ferritin
MLSKNLLKLLNEQIGHEFASANLYLQMSAWCAYNGLVGSSFFLRHHSQEEMMHMFKLWDYVSETGAQPLLGPLEAPRSEFESLLELFRATLEHEKFITGKINNLVDAALQEKDYASFNFLQWYVAEQHEEEALFQGILDRIELVGTEGRGLYFIDREIGKMRVYPGHGGASSTTTTSPEENEPSR